MNPLLRNDSALFDNALESIRMGVEDYALDKPARSLSAVRNFYAGLLLLAKEALARRAPAAELDDVIAARFKACPRWRLGGVPRWFPMASRQSTS